MRLLDESFPLEEEQQVELVILVPVLQYGIVMDSSRTHHFPHLFVQLHDAGGGRGELVSSILHSTNPSLDLELHWQDLFAIMEPQVR